MVVAVLILIVALVGCSGTPPPASEVVALQTIPAVTPRATASPTVASLLEPTPLPPIMLSVWLPERFAPLDNTDAAALRAAWGRNFAAFADNVTLEFRLKQAADVGGIIQTLRTGALVAPSAMPDIVLLRRMDLVTAANIGLIQPLDATRVRSITEDFHSSVLGLGMIEEQLYGLPYTVDVEHLALSPTAAEDTDWTFDAFLARGEPLLFPGTDANTLNKMFLAEYRAAATPDGTPLPLDQAALEQVLSFYERALALNVISAEVLEYTTSADYMPLLLGQTPLSGVINSSEYLQLSPQAIAPIRYAPMPTAAGNAVTLLDGWVWVITTPDAGRQGAAIRFLNWLFDVERHHLYTEAIAAIPSGRTTLRQIADPAYGLFVDSLVINATAPLNDAAGGVIGRAMQAALVSVLLGEKSAAAAAQGVIDQLSAG